MAMTSNVVDPRKPSGVDTSSQNNPWNALANHIKARQIDRKKRQAIADAEAKAKAEQEKAKKQKENEEYYKGLQQSLEGTSDVAKATTEKQAVQSAADTSLTNQATMLGAGLNKSQAATLGSAQMQSDTSDYYTENITSNEDAAFKDALMKAVLSLQARGDYTTAENIKKAGEAMGEAATGTDIANIINLIGQGASGISEILGRYE